MTDPSTSGAKSSRSPLFAALDAEIVALERSIARALQRASVLAIVIAGVVGLFIAPDLGRELAIASLGFLCWFTALRALLGRGKSIEVLRWIALAVELAIPGVALVATARAQGAGYALASWVPPILFALFIFLSTVRLRPMLPAAMGVLGALEYLALYVVVLRGAPASTIDPAIAMPSMQLVRAGTIIVLGSVATIATIALRRAVTVAARRTRARELFGKYRLGALIAAGGMGTVYEALYCPEGGFERKVAIKRVHPHLAKDPEAVASFRAEAELCARLAHPNIVAVLDFGITEDTYFFAMEHVDGVDLLRLRKLCKAAGVMIPTGLVARIGREIAEGLSFAHESALASDGRRLRVIHRDLNPSNVLVSKMGQVKISDFGIARVLGDSGDYETRSLVGKIPYFSPEQARGEPVDTRSDLFSLGLVLWELLCQRAVFKRATDAETLAAILHTTAPAPSSERADLHDGPWDAFSAKALDPDPSRRFQTAHEMSAELARILEQERASSADDLAAFLLRVETEAPAALESDPVLVDPVEPASTSDEATVREPPSSRS